MLITRLPLAVATGRALDLVCTAGMQATESLACQRRWAPHRPRWLQHAVPCERIVEVCPGTVRSTFPHHHIGAITQWHRTSAAPSYHNPGERMFVPTRAATIQPATATTSTARFLRRSAASGSIDPATCQHAAYSLIDPLLGDPCYSPSRGCWNPMLPRRRRQ